MFYPEEFKTRVRAAYPNLPKLYDHMEAGERHMVKQFLEAGIEIKQGVSWRCARSYFFGRTSSICKASAGKGRALKRVERAWQKG